MKTFIRSLNYLSKYHILSLYYNSTRQYIVPLLPTHSLLSLLLRRAILPTYQGIQGSNPPLPHQLLQPGWSVSLGQLYTYHESMFFLPTSRIWQQTLYQVHWRSQSSFNKHLQSLGLCFQIAINPTVFSILEIIMKSITMNSSPRTQVLIIYMTTCILFILKLEGKIE